MPFSKKYLLKSVQTYLGERLVRTLTRPEVGQIDWSSLRKPTPVSRWFGADRGVPIDRFYIERFLSANKHLIQGTVLEVGDNTYTRKFGTNVLQSLVLHARPGNPDADIVADLVNAPELRSEQFDCMILTQTLQMIFDLRAAVATLYRLLRPGGTLLVTVPGISQISQSDMIQWGDLWRFTTESATRLFREHFESEELQVSSCGNVLSATSFLFGLCRMDLDEDELLVHDKDYQVVICVMARKGENVSPRDLHRDEQPR